MSEISDVNELLAVDRGQAFELGTEDRFPLDLTSTRPNVWAAYEIAIDEVWDPEDESLWVGLDSDNFGQAERQAGALVWSQRAWIDYAAMAESEAVLVRACLEPAMSADFKYCVGMRAVERARSVDMCRMAAERLDRYHTGPASKELERLLNDDLVRRALHAKTDLGAYLAAHLVAQATIDLHSWEGARVSVTDGLGALMDLVIADKARMVDVAWAQLTEMASATDQDGREAIATNTAYVLFNEEGQGRQLPTLLRPSADSAQLVAAHEIAAGAGLGGISASRQHEIFDAAILEIGDRMSDLGIDVQRPLEHQ